MRVSKDGCLSRASHMNRALRHGQRGFLHRLGQRRVRVAGARDVLGGGAELHRRPRPRAIMSPASGPDDVHAEHAVGLGVGEDLHEAVGLVVGLGAAVGGERELSRRCRRRPPPSAPPRSCRPRRSPGTCRRRSGSRRSSRGRPGRRGFPRPRCPRPRPCAPASARRSTSPIA